MMDLFNRTAFESSRIVTRAYSTSFTLGIRTLDKRFHEAIYSIYGMVRYADEIVDSFHHYDKKYLLDKFKKDTFEAIEQKISLNPILQAYQLTIHKYKIDNALTEAFFHSMEMDLNKNIHDDDSYNKYIYGSAEVVGIMCLKIFTENNQEEFNSLEKYARALGAAFQKVNFLRDLKSDFAERGRVYFPGLNFNAFTPELKKIIEADIQKDFDIALIGIKGLPSTSRNGVYLAYKFYLKLFDKIKNTEAEKIQTERIRVSDYQKASLMISALFHV
ncbi:MAG: phytoene/squalene synthase family protein [Bacteroidota bacterium]